VLQSQLTILPGLYKDSEMDGTVVHNLDTEQTGSQIYDTQVLHASYAWLQGHMEQCQTLIGVSSTDFRAIPFYFPGAVVEL